MTKRAALAAVLVLLSSPVWARAQNMAAVEKQLIANERAVNEAFAKGDVKAFRSMVTADGFSIDPLGMMTVADYEKMFAGVKIAKWNIENPRVTWLTADVALVTYRWTGSGTVQGQPVMSPAWASTVWVKQADGRWLGKFHQETAAMMPPAPAAKK
jgi:ketosteroid isomerase-like protein